MKKKLLSFVIAVSGVMGTAVGVSGHAIAANTNPKSTALRPGCVWQDEKTKVQTCKVYSKAMHHDIYIHVRPGGQKAIYFLDGARTEDNLSGWLKYTRIVKDFAKDPVSLVFPAGGLAGWYADWNKKSSGQPHIYKWDTFTTKELPQYLAANFGIGNYHNSLVGLSMSAASALNFAAKYPKQFNTVVAMSGYYNTGSLQTGIIDQVLNGSNSMDMWPLGSPKWFTESPMNPALISSLRKNHTKVVISIGDSIPYNQIYLNGSISSLSSYESYSSLSTGSFASEATALGLPIELQIAPGNHLWENWTAIVLRNKALLERGAK